MREKILEVLAKTLNVDVHELSNDMKISDIPNFESLQFVMVISELYENYNINIPLDKAITIETLGELIDCAESN